MAPEAASRTSGSDGEPTPPTQGALAPPAPPGFSSPAPPTERGVDALRAWCAAIAADAPRRRAADARHLEEALSGNYWYACEGAAVLRQVVTVDTAVGREMGTWAPSGLAFEPNAHVYVLRSDPSPSRGPWVSVECLECGSTVQFLDGETIRLDGPSGRAFGVTFASPSAVFLARTDDPRRGTLLVRTSGASP